MKLTSKHIVLIFVYIVFPAVPVLGAFPPSLYSLHPIKSSIKIVYMAKL